MNETRINHIGTKGKNRGEAGGIRDFRVVPHGHGVNLVTDEMKAVLLAEPQVGLEDLVGIAAACSQSQLGDYRAYRGGMGGISYPAGYEGCTEAVP